MSNCPTCREGTLALGTATVTLERDGAIVLLKFVPASVCDNCESYFLDSPMTRRVMEIAENAFQKGAELEVISLAA